MESENRREDDIDEDDNCDEDKDGFIWAPDSFRIISRIRAEGGMKVRVLPRVGCNAITLFAGGYR
jgi:hypothetical protein